MFPTSSHASRYVAIDPQSIFLLVGFEAGVLMGRRTPLRRSNTQVQPSFMRVCLRFCDDHCFGADPRCTAAKNFHWAWVMLASSVLPSGGASSWNLFDNWHNDRKHDNTVSHGPADGNRHTTDGWGCGGRQPCGGTVDAVEAKMVLVELVDRRFDKLGLADERRRFDKLEAPLTGWARFDNWDKDRPIVQHLMTLERSHKNGRRQRGINAPVGQQATRNPSSCRSPMRRGTAGGRCGSWRIEWQWMQTSPLHSFDGMSFTLRHDRRHRVSDLDGTLLTRCTATSAFMVFFFLLSNTAAVPGDLQRCTRI
jgi:hypothetical protein